jgi:2-C-methyl-D-erythritol 4-phosphate cytidylyltransferase
MHTVNVFYNYDKSFEIIITLPSEFFQTWRELCQDYDFSVPHKVIEGGETRFNSVKNSLNAIGETGIVAIHDGVRPLVCRATIEKCLKTAIEKGNAIPVVGVIDSIRKINIENSKPEDRSSFVLVQTPQIFDVKIIKEAYKQDYNQDFTDDAHVVEKMGVKINLVEGNRENIKITEPKDVFVAEALLNTMCQ